MKRSIDSFLPVIASNSRENVNTRDFSQGVAMAAQHNPIAPTEGAVGNHDLAQNLAAEDPDRNNIEDENPIDPTTGLPRFGTNDT